ncbi:MAG: hypothetical protein QXU31_00335 [Archaeoglobaceae archaeon]
MLELRELSWKLSFSSTVVSVFFISFAVFYLAKFGLQNSIFVALLLSLLVAILMKFQKSKILKPP